MAKFQIIPARIEDLIETYVLIILPAQLAVVVFFFIVVLV
jgi:hypothetical protein